MRRKYLGKLKGEDEEVLDHATHTIVQQVEAMKSMVNAFSEYARTPALKFVTGSQRLGERSGRTLSRT